MKHSNSFSPHSWCTLICKYHTNVFFKAHVVCERNSWFWFSNCVIRKTATYRGTCVAKQTTFSLPSIPDPLRIKGEIRLSALGVYSRRLIEITLSSITRWFFLKSQRNLQEFRWKVKGKKNTVIGQLLSLHR